MYFEGKNKIHGKKSSKKKHSSLYKKMYNAYIDPIFLSDQLLFSLVWYKKGIFLARFYSCL